MHSDGPRGRAKSRVSVLITQAAREDGGPARHFVHFGQTPIHRMSMSLAARASSRLAHGPKRAAWACPDAVHDAEPCEIPAVGRTYRPIRTVSHGLSEKRQVRSCLHGNGVTRAQTGVAEGLMR